MLAQCLLPVSVIAGQAEEGALLSLMADKAAGNWLKVWIVVDATLVLVGAGTFKMQIMSYFLLIFSQLKFHILILYLLTYKKLLSFLSFFLKFLIFL